jgi:hypothetical protein
MQVHWAFRTLVGLLGVLCDDVFRIVADVDAAMPQGVAAKTKRKTGSLLDCRSDVIQGQHGGGGGQVQKKHRQLSGISKLVGLMDELRSKMSLAWLFFQISSSPTSSVRKTRDFLARKSLPNG